MHPLLCPTARLARSKGDNGQPPSWTDGHTDTVPTRALRWKTGSSAGSSGLFPPWGPLRICPVPQIQRSTSSPLQQLPGIPSPTFPRELKHFPGSRAVQLEGERGWLGQPSVDKEPFFFSCRETFKMLCQHGRAVYVSPAGKVPIDSGLFPPPHTEIFFPGNFFFFFFSSPSVVFTRERRDGATRIWGLPAPCADLGVLEGFGHPHLTPSPSQHPLSLSPSRGKEQSRDLGLFPEDLTANRVRGPHPQPPNPKGAQ